MSQKFMVIHEKVVKILIMIVFRGSRRSCQESCPCEGCYWQSGKVTIYNSKLNLVSYSGDGTSTGEGVA